MKVWIEFECDAEYYVDREDGIVIESVKLQGREVELTEEQLDNVRDDIDRHLKSP